jgi:hypothetical protein
MISNKKQTQFLLRGEWKEGPSLHVSELTLFWGEVKEVTASWTYSRVLCVTWHFCFWDSEVAKINVILALGFHLLDWMALSSRSKVYRALPDQCLGPTLSYFPQAMACFGLPIMNKEGSPLGFMVV